MANVIEFAVIDDDTVLTVVPLIDGASLIALVAKVELHYGHADSEPAGDYQGQTLTDIAHARAVYVAQQATLLLCSDCADPEYWSLHATIERDGDIVRWSRFSNPQRPNWDYTAVGPFEFEQHQYESALAAIRLPTTMGQ